MSKNIPLDVQAAEDLLMRLLAVEGLSGHETAIAATITEELKNVGVPAEAIRSDSVHTRIPLTSECGNLYVDLPGTRPGPRLLFSTHMDTVPLCAGATPLRQDGKIITDGSTALGGDNRTGCAVLITLVTTLLKHKLPHPPLTLLFTVREESGLQGARYLEAADLKGAAMGFNVDGRLVSDLITGAVGQESWDVTIYGLASHAGVAPEKGISATLVASQALVDLHRDGWFGKIVKGEDRGTSNVGVFGGKNERPAGDATNVVTDYVYIRGESRSPQADFATTITSAYKDAFNKAHAAAKNIDGKSAKPPQFNSQAAYPPFRMDDDAPVVEHARRAVTSLGLTPKTQFSNGGLDANWLYNHGVPTVTIGAGQYDIHTVDEWVDLAEFAQGCRLAIALATQEAQ